MHIIPSFFVDKASCTRQFESELSLHSLASLSPIKEGIFSNPSVSLSKGSSTFSPSPSSSGSGDVAGDAIALPEFWYRKRSLCPKGLAMIAYATELRLFVRCYTALLGGGANRVNFLSMLVRISFYASWDIFLC